MSARTGAIGTMVPAGISAHSHARSGATVMALAHARLREIRDAAGRSLADIIA